MSDLSYEFERFSTREGFNRSLNHFKAVSSMLSDFEHGTNLADLLNELVANKEVEQSQLGPIVFALLVDKYHYRYQSANLPDTMSELQFIAKETKSWNAVDLVITYFHPELGLLVINPKNSKHWELVNALKKNEVVTIFAGTFGRPADEKEVKKLNLALAKLVEYLHGRKSAAPSSLKSGKFKYTEPKPSAPKRQPAPRRARAAAPARGGAAPVAERAPSRGPVPVVAAASPSTAPAAAAPAAAAPAAEGGPKRMTPFYSVPVTNELFHNGNVEAWKRIIQSYQTKYPGLEVYIFYDGERIHDIHALFKWGKVKHGSTILVAVAGENIQDVAKLQRYLRQGASNRFEDFLRFPVNTVLKLF